MERVGEMKLDSDVVNCNTIEPLGMARLVPFRP
jgi:hypothetical protein